MKEVSSVSIISDTHGHIDSHIIDYLKNTDVIIHAGDICSTVIISDLHRYCDQVYMVAGNNDIPERYSDHKDKEIIAKLKKSETIKINNEIISIEHGDRFGHHADHEGLRKSYPQAKLIIYGHTHIQACDQEESPWVINPGACGHTRNNDGGPCFVQIEIAKDDWKIIPYCFN
ncbi:MAG: YfcE family phosphodiesterase [Gammaproteobacteria bacterium]|nr:YfcE family phosphodiesterase [Gammaproteobacteria bacterium]|tara:strand:- start:906 stop:1424 length:519 start_codon:yes stop_codon:yes gene_type:complete